MKNCCMTIYDKSLRLSIGGNEKRYNNLSKLYTEKIALCSKDINAAIVSRMDGKICSFCCSPECAYTEVVDGITNETFTEVRQMLGFLRINQMLNFNALRIPNPNIDEVGNIDAQKIAFIERELSRRFGVSIVYRDMFSIKNADVKVEGSPYKVIVELRVLLAELLPVYFHKFYSKKLGDVRAVAEIIDEFGDKIPKFYRIIYPDLGSVNYDIFNWHLSPIAISEFLNRYNECEDPKDMEKFFSRLGYSNTRLFNDMDWESVKNMTFFENNTDLDISEKLRKRCYFGSKAKENYPVVASFIRKKYKPSFVAACIRG